MKYIFVLVAAVSLGAGQTDTASISGTVVDAKTQQPIPAAIVMAIRHELPPLSRNTKSGADGTFRMQGLPAGKYALCVQAPGEAYIDPCQWSGPRSGIVLAAGQAAAGLPLRLTAASFLSVQVEDPQDLLSQRIKNGRSPEVSVGVWGPMGLYHPARAVAAGAAAVAQPAGKGAKKYSYRIAIPRDTALKLHIGSKDVKLGDARGAMLPDNASQQAFQHATGDANPKSFSFTVLGPLP